MSLIKLVVVLALIGVVLFDAGAVLVNQVQTDELGQEALRAAVQSAQTPAGRQPTALEEAASAPLSGSERARLESVTLDAEGLTVTISQDARVAVLDRLGPLADLATAEVTKQAERTG